MTKIKICGLSRPCDIEAVNRYRPDYCGFIFAEKSPRCVTAEQAAELKRLLAPEITAVGVFVDAPPEAAAELAEAGVIELIQLHGHETEAYLKRLRELTRAPVIRAFSVRRPEDLERAAASKADYILLDNGAGGSGRTFDWKLLDGCRPWGRPEASGGGEAFGREGAPELRKQLGKRCFLAGGLTPDNVEEAVRRFRPFAVDLNSGLETDGVKDPEKIRICIRRIRNV